MFEPSASTDFTAMLPPHLPWWAWPARFVILFSLIFVVLFGFANYPGLHDKFISVRAAQATVNSPLARYELWRSQAKPDIPQLSANELSIPRLDIKAPLAEAPDNQPATLASLLKNNVVHMANSGQPGRTGNVVIAGHSSGYIWDQTEHLKSVFAGLPNLEVGDLIWLSENGQTSGYAVIRTAVVPPNQTDVLQSTNQPLMTLFTCYPIGTTLNRFVVIGKLVHPQTPLPTDQSSPLVNLAELPSVR